MTKHRLTIDEVMAILPETPRRVVALTDGLTEARLHTAPELDGWSVNDVLAHLRACHDILGGNLLRILHEDRPAWKGVSPRAWLRRTDYPDWAFAAGFEVFRRQRAELLEVLESLPPDAWDRTATVTGMVGDVHQYSALYYADWMAGHERAHWGQIARTVAALGGIVGDAEPD